MSPSAGINRHTNRHTPLREGLGLAHGVRNEALFNSRTDVCLRRQRRSVLPTSRGERGSRYYWQFAW
jgi:hypothetical protein